MAHNRVDIKNRVKRVLLQKQLRGVDESALGFDTPLLDFGVGVDSVATLELLVALEDEFGVSIDEEKVTLKDLETIESVADLIARHA